MIQPLPQPLSLADFLRWEQWSQEPTLVGDGVLAFRVDVEIALDEMYRRTSLDTAP